MFIFREEYYLSRGRADAAPGGEQEKFNERYERWKERCEATYGIAEVIVAKQRHGPIGTVKLHFEAETTKFDNFIGAEQLPAELCAGNRTVAVVLAPAHVRSRIRPADARRSSDVL